MIRLEDLGYLVRLVAVAAGLLWAQLHPLYQLLLVLIAMDIATGITGSLIAGVKISSDLSFKGILKKVMKLLSVGLGSFLEPYAGGIPLGPALAGYWCADELISIVENYGKAKLPIPKPLRVFLSKFMAEYGYGDRDDQGG